MADMHLSGTQSSIMVVDDDPELVTILRAMLEDKAYKVKSVYSGKDLFAGLEEEKPDIILLDLMMPQMDGLEVLEQLKGDPDTASIPVILLTAKAHPQDVLGGYKLGADYYITKPFTSTQLLDGINLIFSEDQRHSDRLDQLIKI